MAVLPEGSHDICLQQETSVLRSMCTCAYQPFRGIYVKFMKCVGCSQGVMHEKECACMHSHWSTCRDFSLKVFFVSGRGIKKSRLYVFLVCVFAVELHVWESLLWSGAMEHHIVVVRGWDDYCFVCSSS